MSTSPTIASPNSHTAPTIPDGLSAYLRQVLDSLDVFVGLLTPDGTLVEANYTALAAAGLRPEDVLEKPFEDTYWWSYSSAVQAQLRAAIERAARGEGVRHDVVVRVGDDHYITIDFRLVPLFDPQGQVQFLIPYAVDITERLQTTRQLRESEARFRATFEQAAVGIAHVGLDGQWLRVNQKLCDIVGYTRDELLQRTFQDITYPPDLDIDLAYARQLLAGEIATYSMEKRYVRRDGSLVWINLTGSLVRDATGAPNYFIAIIEDITLRKRVEEALQFQGHLLSQVQDAIVAIDNDGRVVFWNAAAHTMYGVAADKALGQPLTSLYQYKWLEPGADQAAYTALETGGTWRGENIHVTPDGGERWVESTVSVLKDEQGRCTGLLAIIRDISERRAAREALRQSEERLQRAAQAAGFGMYELDLTTGENFWSPQLKAIFGLPVDAPVPLEGVGLYIHPLDRDRVLETLLRSYDPQGTGEYEAEHRVVRPDGMVRWVLSRGRTQFAGEGVARYPVRVSGVVIDTTMRRQAEEALRDSEARFRAALAGSPVTVFNQDRDLRYTWLYNPSAGYEVETVLGKTDADILERPADVAILTALKQQVLTSGVGVRQEVRIHSGPQVNYFDLAIEPLRDDDGHIVGITAASTDITHRKLAEERQRLLAEASAVLSSSLDYETTLQGVARLALPMFADYCAVYLIQDDDQIRQVAIAHVDPAKEAALRDGWRDFPLSLQSDLPIARVLRTGRPDLVADISRPLRASLEQTFLEQAQTAMVRELPATSYIIVPLVIRGEVIGGLAFVWAESARHYDADDLDLARELAHRAALAIDNARLYQQAQEAVQVREEFLSIASHELKTPITSLQLQMQLLLMHTRRGTLGHLPAERLAKILETGEQQVKRLAVLVNDLLDVSRISAQGLELRRETTDLAQIVEAVVERFGPEAASHGSALHVRASPAVGNWDPNRLEQVAVNLLSNAIKYGNGRPIEISVMATPTSARLIVRDQGIGIPADRLAHIFERFERAVADMSYSGIGLGLYITRQIVEGHGGRIQVESAPGQGSTFTVELPLTADE